MRLSARDYDRLTGCHTDLVQVAELGFYLFGREIVDLDGVKLTITEGLRTEELQRQYVAAGKSQTMNSRHLTGHAFDFAVVTPGIAHWEYPMYERVWIACFRAAGMLYNINVEWGGAWTTLVDAPHVQLSRKDYP